MKRLLPADLTVENTLNTQLNNARDERTSHVAIIKDPRRQFQESAFQATADGPRSRLESVLTGTPLSAFYPMSSNNILESFRTRNVSASIEQALPQTETANDTQPVTRFIKPHTDTLDGAGMFELVFEYKVSASNNMETIKTAAGYMPSQPMDIVNAAIFNLTLMNQQLFDAKQDYEDYLLKTPWDYWANWSVGGVIQFEEMMNGAESSMTSGFSGVGSIRSQNAAGYKAVTITTKGPEFMYNLFGHNISPAGKCYAIIKKHAMPTEFNLDNKRNLAALSGLHRVTERMPLINNVPHLVKPYQMSFVCLPSGGSLPEAATMYYDENEILRRDGLAIYLGKVWSVPYNHVFKNINNYYDVDPITSRIPNVNEYTACNDASQGIDREGIMLMKLILDCDDSIGAL